MTLRAPSRAVVHGAERRLALPEEHELVRGVPLPRVLAHLRTRATGRSIRVARPIISNGWTSSGVAASAVRNDDNPHVVLEVAS